MTDALSLLDGAEATLRGLAGSLEGENRYAVLLSANAVATARRDFATAARSDALCAGLGSHTAAIRAGDHDDDRALYDRLVAYGALRAWVSDPKALTDAERSEHVEGKG